MSRKENKKNKFPILFMLFVITWIGSTVFWGYFGDRDWAFDLQHTRFSGYWHGDSPAQPYGLPELTQNPEELESTSRLIGACSGFFITGPLLASILCFGVNYLLNVSGRYHRRLDDSV